MTDNIIIKKEFDKYNLEMDSRGFLWIKHKPDVTFELEDAIQQENELISICEGKLTSFVIDVRILNWNAPKEVRNFHATSKKLQNIRKSEAILINNLGLRILANTYNKLNNPPNPVKIFTNEAEAINWSLKL